MQTTVKPLDYPKKKINLWVENEHEASFRVHATAKEPYTVDWIERTPPEAIIWDVGACVGSYTLIAAALGRRTVAVECGYANYGKLCKNLALNNLLDRVLVLPVALGNQNCVTWMHYRDIQPGAASHTLGQPLQGDKPLQFHRQMIVCWRMDDLIKGFGLPAPTHIKLDVDGFEEAVLGGATETLKGVQSIMVEIQPHQNETVPKILTEAGFTMAQMHEARGIRYGEFVRVAA